MMKNDDMCRKCGQYKFVGHPYAARHELGSYELLCKFCQKIEDDKVEVQAKKNRRKCFWFGHNWGEERLHRDGLARYCQRPGCGKEYIIYMGGYPD